MDSFLTNKIFPYLQKKWKTKSGLIVELSLLIIGVTYAYMTIGEVLILILIPIISGMWLFIWSFFSRRIIINPSDKKIILLSFNVETEAKKQFNRIIELLENKLVDLSLTTKINLMVGAEDLINNMKEAEVWRGKNNIDLIVWGKTIFGRLNEKKVSQFIVHHTFKVTPSLQKKLPLFLGDIILMLQKRNWTIYEMNDITDYKIVAEDLLETCLFIIGLYFFDQQEFDNAIKVFESLLPVSNGKTMVREKENIMYLAQTGRINALLIDLYFLKSIEYQEKGNIDGELLYLEKIPEKIQNQIPILMNLAKCYYQSGNLKKAIETTIRIKKIDKKHPAVSINFAFFGLLQHNYDRVRFWYDELLKNDNLGEIQSVGLLEFLDNEHQKYPSEYAFLYGMAIINYFVDKIMMKKYLRQFLRITKKREKYFLLSKRAQELLDKSS